MVMSLGISCCFGWYVSICVGLFMTVWWKMGNWQVFELRWKWMWAFLGGSSGMLLSVRIFIWVLANLWDMSWLWMRKDGKLVANFEILVLFTLFDYLWEFSLAVKCSIWPLTKIWCKFVEVKVCIWNWTLFFGREIFFNFDFFTFALIYELKKEQLLWNMLKNCNLYVSAHFIHVIYQ